MSENNAAMYHPQLLRIESRLPDGTPDILRWIRKDDNVELSENVDENCFLMVYSKDNDFSKFAGQIVTPGLEEDDHQSDSEKLPES